MQNKEKIINFMSTIHGLEWLQINSNEHSENEIQKLFQKMIKFRTNWNLIDCQNIRIESWKIDQMKLSPNNTPLYNIEPTIHNPIDIIENGIFLEVIDQTPHYQIRRYLLNNTIYHIFIDSKSDHYEYKIMTTGYECYKNTRQPRKIKKSTKSLFNDCSILIDLLTTFKNHIRHGYYIKQEAVKLYHMINKIQKDIAKYHITGEI